MPTPVEPEDVFAYRAVTELACVPAAEAAACAAQSLDRDNDRSSTAIWLVPLDDAKPYAFTHGPDDSTPRWSLDGSPLALNAVGSASYGREFGDRLRGRWGKYGLAQHLAAASALHEEGGTGKSYGGFLSAWTISHSRKFRAAVIGAPVADLENHFAVPDSGYYADQYSMHGKPNAQRERMVMYPGADHHFTESGKPSHRLDAALRLVQWLERGIDVAVEDERDAPSKTECRDDPR